ncbi:MAG: hypothetical protein ABIS35_06290 [Terracoccus sp.]
MSNPRLDPAVTEARERARRTLPVSLLMLLGVVAMYLPLPKRFVAVLPLLVAGYLTVALLRFLSGRPGRQKVWPGITLGIIALLLASLASQAAFYPTVHAYEQCLAGAQTSQARGVCEQNRATSPLGFLTG